MCLQYHEESMLIEAAYHRGNAKRELPYPGKKKSLESDTFSQPGKNAPLGLGMTVLNLQL